MDSFDDKIRGLMSDDDNQKMPLGYSWDDNADAIYSKMESDKSSKRRILEWISGLAALAISVAFVMWYLFSSAAVTPQVSDQPSIVVADRSVEESQDQGQEISAPLTTNHIENTLPAARTIEKLAIPSKQAVNRKTEIQNLSDINNSSSPLANDHHIIAIAAEAPKETLITPLVEISLLELANPVGSLEHVSVQEARTEESLSAAATSLSIPLIGSSKYFLATGQKATTLKFAPLADLPFFEKTTASIDCKLNSSVGLRAGSDIAMGNYGGAGAIRNNYSSWLPGYHAGIDFAVENSRGWSLSLGYDQDFAVQLFDFNEDDFVTHQQEDVVTHIVVNALTGSETHTTGTFKQELARVRDYKTYNTFRSHGFSTVVGKRFQLGNAWSLGVAAGGRYTFARASSGYTLDRLGEIQAYGQGNDIYKASTADLIGELNIGYRLTNNLAVRAYARANKSISNWSSEETTLLRPTLIQLGTGIAYHF